MPRQAAIPYANSILQTKKDITRRKRSLDTSSFFKNVAHNMSGRTSVTSEVLLDNWNSTYAEKLDKNLKTHNLGTSFLVAPINHTVNEKVKENFKEVQSFLRSKNEMYIKALTVDDEVGSDGAKSP